MPAMAKLSEPEIQEQMASAKGWERHGDMLVRSWQFPTFRRALAFVNEVGAAVDRLGHYPDIHLSFRTVQIQLNTHDHGGLTPRDFELASQLSALPTD
jgi:4a-hydroxytetrahydrobiopterin dehydratase